MNQITQNRWLLGMIAFTMLTMLGCQGDKPEPEQAKEVEVAWLAGSEIPDGVIHITQNKPGEFLLDEISYTEADLLEFLKSQDDDYLAKGILFSSAFKRAEDSESFEDGLQELCTDRNINLYFEIPTGKSASKPFVWVVKAKEN